MSAPTNYYFRRTHVASKYLTGTGLLTDPFFIAFGTGGDADRADMITFVTAVYGTMGLSTPTFITQLPGSSGSRLGDMLLLLFA